MFFSVAMNPTRAHPQSPASRHAHGGTSFQRGWRRTLARLGLVLLGVLPLVALEGALRLWDAGSPAAQADPLAGFNGQMPLFERQGEVYRTVHARESFFNAQEFAAVKPANGFRVFCFGGSTVYGHPYLSDTAFPKWLELELAAGDPSRRVEAINCGGISYASYRLAPILREVLGYAPDLIVLAMGHNEFLEDRTYQSVKTRSAARRWIEDRAFSLRIVTRAWRLLGCGESSATPSLPAEVKARLDDVGTGYASYHRDTEWHAQVQRQFADTLRSMIGECRAAQVPALLVTLGSNLRDCPPFKSEHKAGLTPEDEARWQRCFDEATRAKPSDLDTALASYRQAEALDGEHALLAWRTARCLDRLGQPAAARDYYVRAKDEDICPLRMVDAIYEAQLALAAETGTPLVNARALLEALSPDAIPGSDLYVDHVHPTIGGHQRIAQAVATKLDEAGIFPLAAPWSPEVRRAAYRQHLQRLPPAYFSNGRRRVKWLEDWACRHRLQPETLPVDTRGLLHQGYRLADLGEEAPAWLSLESAWRKDDGVARQLIGHALELRAQGRPEEAGEFLARVGVLPLDAGTRAELERRWREKFGTEPRYFLVGAVVGVVAAFLHFWKMYRAMSGGKK